eukprot:3723040-Rhodomonas_salina.3
MISLRVLTPCCFDVRLGPEAASRLSPLAVKQLEAFTRDSESAVRCCESRLLATSLLLHAFSWEPWTKLRSA